MKTLLKSLMILLLILHVGIFSGLSQQPAAPAQPVTPIGPGPDGPPNTVVVPTIFGLRVIEQPAQNPPAPAAPPANPVVQAEPPAPPPQADDAVPLELRFETPTDINNVIRIIMSVLNLNYVVDPAVRGTVNIVAVNNIRRSDLLPILETMLKINGATMVKNGNFYQIVPASAAARQPLAVQEGPLPPNGDDQMVMQILRMRFVSATEMAALLNPVMTEGASIVAHAAGNVLLITERKSNLRKLQEIIDIFDTNAFKDEHVRLFPVQNNLARDLVSDLNSVFAGYGLSPATAIRFLPIERINMILVVASNPLVFPEVEKWMSKLDQSTLRAGTRNHVYKVKNTKALDLQSVLAQLYGGQIQLSTIYGQPAGAGTPASPPAAAGIAANVGGTSQVATAPPALPNRNGDIRIIADINQNALVIQATAQAYQEIERTIQDLDVLPRQVFIEAQIYEVSLDDSMSLGLSAVLQNRGTLSNPQTTASFASSGGPPTLAAATFAFIGRSRELAVFLNASENRSRVRTLSAPSVLVSDNMTADFQVGAEVPVPTSSSVTPVQSDGNNLFAQTIAFRPVGVILKVRPQINDGGNVTLEIMQEVSQAGANTTSAVVAPVINKASVSSTIVLQDGQTIALSGFIRENSDLASSRVPLLGRIPYLGALFGSTRNAKGRSELVVLITPHVVTTHQEAVVASDELKAKLKEIQKMLK